MKILVCGIWEEHNVRFARSHDDIWIASPSEDLLASAVCLTDLPVCALRIPGDPTMAKHYLIAHASPKDVDPTYGENEDWIEITYSEEELQNLLRMFDAK